MGGKARKRREKNYAVAHGIHNRLPPPPTSSSINALPSKLRKLMSLSSSSFSPQQGSKTDLNNTQKNNSKDYNAIKDKHTSERKLESKSNKKTDEVDKKLLLAQVAEEKGDINNDANDENKKKKRKRKQVNDLRFETEMEKLGALSKRRQRKKEYLKAKKKKPKKENPDETLDFPKHEEITFGDVVQAPPKLTVIPKAPKKPLDASHERLRLRAIEAYRSRKGWANRPGVHLPPVSMTPDV